MRLVLLAVLLPLWATAQTPKLHKFWVEFTDKNHTPYSIWQPAEFLSARALERRARAGIAVVENDLPVDPAYLNALKINGLQLHSSSRWLNAAAVIADSATLLALPNLPFVKKISWLGPHLRFRNAPNRPPKGRRPLSDPPSLSATAMDWGYATRQNARMGLFPLFAAGHRGAGIWIAVMDGGFTNVDTMPFFDSLALQGRLFQGRDFVERDAGVFESAQHGTAVLSVMGANLPRYFVGTAPDATYFLLKTEDTGGEYPIEEANWIAGAEWADSVGVDVINASLGYTHFNDKRLNHKYLQLDGRTAIGSRGASIAATKGMIICNSAGNEGDSAWRYIGVPADAPGIIAVGADAPDDTRASFSSTGPTADGRIKPDLMAPGERVLTAGGSGVELALANGTSLASPLLAGALAALWSTCPTCTAAEVLEAVYHTAQQPLSPDTLRGYGRPDLHAAWLELGGYALSDVPFTFDRAAGTLRLLVPGSEVPPGTLLSLHRATDGALLANSTGRHNNLYSTLIFDNLGKLPPGIYRVRGLSGAATLWWRVALW